MQRQDVASIFMRRCINVIPRLVLYRYTFRQGTKAVNVTHVFLSVLFDLCRILVNLYHSLGIFSRRQIDDIFLIFPRKQDLTFHANCLLGRQLA